MLKKIFLTILLVIFIISLWQIVENQINAKRLENNQTGLEAFVPSPYTIYKTYLSDGHIIIKETLYTLSRAGVGFSLGTLFAIIVSFIFLFIPTIRNTFLPLAFAINAFPIVGLAPAIILAFGQGSALSIIFISALICYFPILISLDSAFRETDKGFLELMNIYNASTWQKIIKIRIPLALPYFFLSLKLAIPASIIGATMGEWLGTRYGVGQLITISLYQLKPGLLYASLISITAVSISLILLLSIIQYYLFPWKRTGGH